MKDLIIVILTVIVATLGISVPFIDKGQPELVIHTPVGKYSADFERLTISLEGENDNWTFTDPMEMVHWLESTTEGDSDFMGNMYLIDNRDHEDDCFQVTNDYTTIGYFCPLDERLEVFYFENAY